MIKTLHYYLWRDLLKVTLLAVAALTLIMTVFAIIEPLRKQQGMAAEQVLLLLSYTMPVMLSLTLPIGTLFAATIVYGRFSQDNELTACRASGISTMGLVQPALTLGLIVTAISLVLSNFVAPKMVTVTKVALEQNLKGITYRQLRTKNFLKYGSNLVHADSVDEEQNIIHGVVFADSRKGSDLNLLVASSARVIFRENAGSHSVQIGLSNPRLVRTSTGTVVLEESQPLVRELDNPLRDRPSMMNWDRLLDSINHPFRCQQIMRLLEKIKRDLLYEAVAMDVVSAIEQAKVYDGLAREVTLPGMAPAREQYVLHATAARAMTDDKAKPRRYYAELTGQGEQGVKIEIRRDGQLIQTCAGPSAIVEASWSELSESSLVNLTLNGPVTVTNPLDQQSQRRASHEVGQLPLPKEANQAVDPISLEDIFTRCSTLTRNPVILQASHACQINARDMLNAIQAEMHGRVAYSVSCFLLVSLGAALGLVFRGGNIITAFAITAIPGALIMILILQGKTIMENAEVNPLWGLAVIWGSIALMFLATVIVYARLLRK